MSDIKQDKIFAVCDFDDTFITICESEVSREDVIRKATEYFEQKRFDDGEYGDFQLDVKLCIYSVETGNETVEDITLDICVEKDTCDGGRSDYYGSRI